MKRQTSRPATKATQDPEKALGFVLNDVARLLRRNFNQRLQSLGLTQAQCRVIFYLSRCEGTQQVALAEVLEVQPITLGRLVDKLEASGYVERRRDPLDRRAFCLHLTPKARPLLEKIWLIGAESRADMAGDLDEQSLKPFLDTLLVLKRNLLKAENNPAKQQPRTSG